MALEANELVMDSTPPMPSKPPGNGGGEYDESKIQVLDDQEHVRARPAMYIGDVGQRGLHHLVYEVIDNSIDEAMAGICRNITLTIKPDNIIIVEDDGRGIPVGVKEEFGMSALELCLTKLGAGGKFDRQAYKVSGGLHGVGVSVVNFLSEYLNAEVARDGQIWTMGFARGKTVRGLKSIGNTERTGTKIEFKPDAEVFREINFHYDVLAKRLRELSYLNSGLTIGIRDERENKSDTFHFEHGLKEFVEHLNEGKEALHNCVCFKREDAETRLICEVAFQYNDGYNENTLSFVNNIHTVEGGTHLTGFRAALTRCVNNYARKSNLLKANDPAPQGDDIREGMAAVLSVMVPEPQFEGQTKTKLGNSEVGTFVETTVNELLNNYLEEHPAEAKRLVNKAVQAALAREAARKARETARKSALSGGGFSRKLVDCSSRNVDETEIFIVEGDSAAGSAKGYRDSKTQAILPIRGKILNVEKARLHKVLSHEEILEIIKALGTGIGAEDFDITKLRYGRIILMTDADVDGSHIRTLLLTFFFRHLRPLIEKGAVFIAQPPLYQLAKGKGRAYVLDDSALNLRLATLGLEQTSLVIRRAGAHERVIDAASLADMLKLLEEIERQSKILARRGIEFRTYVQRHLKDGRLPTVRGASGDDERYFMNEAEFDAWQRPLAAAGALVQKTDLSEARVLQRAFERLSEFGCSTGDLFLRREEQITGELSPATFVLRHGEGEPLELDNLASLPAGVRALGSRGWEIKRFKGLGEMNKEELWETTMDPANRTMRKVIVGESDSDPDQTDIDAVEADRVFSILMGDAVDVRKKFIEENAIHVKNLDI